MTKEQFCRLTLSKKRAWWLDQSQVFVYLFFFQNGTPPECSFQGFPSSKIECFQTASKVALWGICFKRHLHRRHELETDESFEKKQKKQKTTIFLDSSVQRGCQSRVFFLGGGVFEGFPHCHFRPFPEIKLLPPDFVVSVSTCRHAGTNCQHGDPLWTEECSFFFCFVFFVGGAPYFLFSRGGMPHFLFSGGGGSVCVVFLWARSATRKKTHTHIYMAGTFGVYFVRWPRTTTTTTTATTYYLLPTSYYLLPTSYYLLVTTY